MLFNNDYVTIVLSKNARRPVEQYSKDNKQKFGQQIQRQNAAASLFGQHSLFTLDERVFRLNSFHDTGREFDRLQAERSWPAVFHIGRVYFLAGHGLSTFSKVGQSL